MSEPLNSNPIQHYKRTPKKFLRKGEGLKRFAAYKPPPPKVINTKRSVKFDLNNKYAENKSSYLPDILLDDSINLSMEVPKIGPPKIFHTPIRPPAVSRLNLSNYNNNNNNNNKTKNDITTRNTESNKLTKKPGKRYNLRKRGQIEAVVQRHITPPPSPTPSPPPLPECRNTTTETQINGNIDNLLKKIKQKKTVLDQENIVCNNNHILVDDESNYERCRTPTNVERHSEFDLSTPTPGSCILALGKQIQQIQSTVNELKEKIKNCSCGMEPAIKPPVTRVTRRKQQSKTAKEDTNTARLSALADNSTPKILVSLLDEVAQLKERFDDLNLKRTSTR